MGCFSTCNFVRFLLGSIPDYISLILVTQKLLMAIQSIIYGDRVVLFQLSKPKKIHYTEKKRENTYWIFYCLMIKNKTVFIFFSFKKDSFI